MTGKKIFSSKSLAVGVILLFVGLSFLPIVRGNIEKIRNNYKTNSFLHPENTLQENDEGIHQNNIFNMQEWWYYNVYFNDEQSELKNWSLVMSFIITSKTSSCKLGLYDAENGYYNFLRFKSRDFFQFNGPGVNLSFEDNTFAIGKYPNWHIYAENIESNKSKITVDLTFNTNSLPLWILRNTGNNLSNSIFGYYCIMKCYTKGYIILNGKTYNVSGIGYHDHTWAPKGLKKPTSDGHVNINNNKKNEFFDIYRNWDWLCIHFNNGWDMFIGKLFFNKQRFFSKFVPGILCFSASETIFYKRYFYILEYDEEIDSPIPNVKIPTRIHIKALFLETNGIKQLDGPIFFDFFYEANNIQQSVSGNPPFWGLMQSQGRTYGVAKSLSKNIQLDGWAIMETTFSA